MDTCTDYVLAVLEAHPATSILRLSARAYASCDLAALPDSVTVLATTDDYCECLSGDGTLLIRFRV
jgi:hypothetical protein